MDFETQNVQVDKASSKLTVQLVPSPRRYEIVVEEGKRSYLDKYLRILIPEDVMVGHCVEQMRGVPIYELSPSIKSAPEYAASRNKALRTELETGSYVEPTEKAAPHRPLEASAATKWLVFLSVDICRASALRIANRSAFEAAYKLFIREAGTVVGHFNGAILKTTGDGFIAYIDHPAFTQQCDNAIDMGLSLLRVLRDSIAPTLVSAELPELKIRIGADYGTVQFRTHVVPST
jgi:hypothetical protein